ncbi:MAG: outer membrane protein assembly factor BamA [Nitrosomonadales bacterium]|nr:outer membrane protein assembly factor BamA [Nitrosomonadales bacterium]
MNLKKIAALLPLLYVSSSYAIEPFIVKDIRVEGIQRTEAGTVFSYLPVKVGEKLDDKKSAAAIRALFATGFFKDVRLEVEQGVLVVLVRERPAIASVSINGVKDFPKDQLISNLKNVGLSEGRILDKSALDKSEQELKRQYVARGKYGVTVRTTVTELERNRAAVSFNVIEGEAAKIKQINFVGNHDFPEDELQGMMKLNTTNWLSWISKNDQYSKPKLSADLETLRSYYLDNGYLEFAINSTQVSITPDKKDIYLTVNVTEGAKFTVSDIKLAGGEKVVPHEVLRELLSIKAGDVFSRKQLTESTRKIGERLGDEGYAFANINAVPEVDKEKHEVKFTVAIDPGQRVYVRRINIEGNTKTRDEVIRREFRQMESGWFAAAKVKKSKQKVDRLDYFSAVNIETLQVPGTSDQLDMKVSVTEKSTGSFSVGAGLSSGEGLVLSGAITQSNIFGSGNFLSTQINTSRVNTVTSVSYTNPYYTDEGVSRGFDVYQRKTNTTATTVLSQYSSATVGAGVRFGVPWNDDNTIQYGLTAEQTAIGLTATSPQRYIDYVNKFGSKNTTLISTVGWTHDGRDSAIYTTEGSVRRVFAEVGLPVASMQYYKLTAQNQWFYPVAKDITLMLNGEVGVGHGYGGKALPFFKNFYAGGIGSVRGYEPNSLGPVDANNLALGGTKRVVANAELLFPIPGFAKDNSLRLSTFVDAGAVYGPTVTTIYPGSMGIRYSGGAALTWISPVGPLKISVGVPLNKQPGDKLQKFQFTLGSLF